MGFTMLSQIRLGELRSMKLLNGIWQGLGRTHQGKGTAWTVLDVL